MTWVPSFLRSHQRHGPTTRAFSPPENFPVVNKQTVCASAPGKVILFGEHAVVYGEPAVAASLSDLCVCVLVTPNTKPKRTPKNDGGVVGTEEEEEENCDSARLRIDLEALDVYVELPITLLAQQGISQNIKTPPTQECAEAIGNILIQPLLQQYQQQQQTKHMNNINQDLLVSALTPLLYLLCVMLPIEQFFCSSSGGIDIQIKSRNLPVGAGLGSSAAFSTALAAALVQLTTTTIQAPQSCCLSEGQQQQQQVPDVSSLKRIEQFAYYSEQLLHGTPSGIDNAVSAHGGAILFQRHHDATSSSSTSSSDKTTSTTSTTTFQSLPIHSIMSSSSSSKTEENQKENVGLLPQHMVLVHTHIPRSTKQLVAHVRDQTLRHDPCVRTILTAMGQIATEFATQTKMVMSTTRGTVNEDDHGDNDNNHTLMDGTSLKKEIGSHSSSSSSSSSSTTFLELMILNQHLLRAVGVSHPQIDAICEIVARVGKTGQATTTQNDSSSSNNNNVGDSVSAAAKLTGAGGGGCVLVAYNNSQDGHVILQALQERFPNLSFFRTKVGGPGVRWISVDDYFLLSSSQSPNDQELVSQMLHQQPQAPCSDDEKGKHVARSFISRCCVRHGPEATAVGAALFVVAASYCLLQRKKG